MKNKIGWLLGVGLVATSLLVSGCASSRAQKTATTPKATTIAHKGDIATKAKTAPAPAVAAGEQQVVPVATPAPAPAPQPAPAGQIIVATSKDANGNVTQLVLRETSPGHFTVVGTIDPQPATVTPTVAAAVTSPPSIASPAPAATGDNSAILAEEARIVAKAKEKTKATQPTTPAPTTVAANNTPSSATLAPAPADSGGGGGGGANPAADPEPRFRAHLDATAAAWFNSGGNKGSSVNPLLIWDGGLRYDLTEAQKTFVGLHSQGLWSDAKQGGSVKEEFCYTYQGSQGPFTEPHGGTRTWERSLLMGNAVGEFGFSKFPYLSLIGGAVFTDQRVEGAIGVGLQYEKKWFSLRADPMWLPDSGDFAFFGNVGVKPLKWLTIGGFGNVVGNDWAAGPMAKLDIYKLCGGKDDRISLGINGGYMWSSLESPAGFGIGDPSAYAGQRTDAPWTGQASLRSSHSTGGEIREGAYVGVGFQFKLGPKKH